jgi:PBSX family phage terminase large subunit
MIWDWEYLANDEFKQFIDNEDRYLIFKGGRGSSKSDFVAKKLIYQCLEHDYFRFILIRKTYSSIKESQYTTIKDIIHELGVERHFKFTEHPYQIKCSNGNRFIAGGMDEPKKIKSIKDPTGVWWEEDIPEESGFITVTTSIRTLKAQFLQEIFTINPEVEGDYHDNWFWKLFFKDRPDNYRGVMKREVLINGKPKEVELTYTTHHSTHEHNPYLPDEFRAYLENLKFTNPYYYEIYTRGNWGNRVTGSQCYKGFDRAKHVRKLKYDEKQALHISFDFNVNPYMTLTIWQIEGTLLKQIDEITAKDPDNNTSATCKIFLRRYGDHTSGLFIYGDPSGIAEDTRSEKGHNDFSIISKELRDLHPQKRLHKKAPAVVSRIQWINSIFAVQEGGLRIQINETCKMTIQDYQNGKEASDGTKFKEKGKDPDTKITHELYHHITDANDYFLTKAFQEEYRTYMRGGREEAPEVFYTDKSTRFAAY